MNKIIAYLVAGIVCIAGMLIYFLVDSKSANTYYSNNGMIIFLINWYMLWKLFHDKKKDE